MKKNTMMRIASCLLIAVLMTTCVISGTFAKYTTTVTDGDAARVAKWEIKFDDTNVSTFNHTYDTTKVKAQNGSDMLVAPGTTDSGTFVLQGSPETAYDVTFAMTSTADVYLAAGDYGYEEADGYKDMDLHLDAEYRPLYFVVTLTTAKTPAKVDDEGVDALSTGANNFNNLAAAMAAVNNTKISFDATDTCDVQLQIAWTWDFETAKTNNKADTVLGDLAASPAIVTTTAEYSLNVNYTLDITATQVD